MGHSVTLGGDRLGAGKKNKVDLHGFDRSTHDLSYIWRSTMAAGTLVPFMVEIAQPGDTWDIKLDAIVKTHPTIGPLFGSYKVQLDVFMCPVRLYQGKLHNNLTRIALNMNMIKLPLIELTAKSYTPDVPDLNNSQINPSSILAYLGIRGVGVNVTGTDKTRFFNATALLAYWDIYKNYYANKQEEKGGVIHTSIVPVVTTVDSIDVHTIQTAGATTVPALGPTVNYIALQQTGFIEVFYTGAPPNLETIMFNVDTGAPLSAAELGEARLDTTNTVWQITFDWAKYGDTILKNWRYIQPYEMRVDPPEVVLFDLEDIDYMKEQILATSVGFNAFSISSGTAATLEPYKYIWSATTGYNHMLSSQEGLGVKTYQSDLFNNWLSTDWIEGPGSIADMTAISTASGSFTVDALMISRAVYNMLTRVAVSGGSYNDWVNANFDEDPYFGIESPVYMGGLSKELVFQEVVSNSDTATGAGAGQPLGTLGGRGIMSDKHKGGTVVIKPKEHSYIMGIISLTPRVDYSQGNRWDTWLRTVDDFHKPMMDNIGFQDLITEQMAWSETSYNGVTALWEQKSAGKQPAWINYQTNINRTYGNFAVESSEMFMTNNRRYEINPANGRIADLTTYIDPMKFNHIFAQTSRDAQNYWTQVGVDIECRRKMSARAIPNL